MKKLLYLLPALCLLLSMTACSENDNPTDVPPDTTHVYGYQLEQFIDQATVTDSVDATAADSLDFRGLFAYEIVSGTDGFSPRQSSFAGYDLNWDTFRSGYLVPSDQGRTWFADPNLPSAFRVKHAGYFRMYRKIEVIAADNSSQMIELRGLPIHQVTNWDGNPEDAIKLSDLLQGIASYDSVSIVCFDDYGLGRYYQPAAINDGYYLLSSERTIFPTAALPSNMKKMKKVAYLHVYGAATGQVHAFDLAPNTAADIIFTVPADLSGYTATELTNYPAKDLLD